MAKTFKKGYWKGPKAYITYPIRYIKNRELELDTSSQRIVDVLLEVYHETRYQLVVDGRREDCPTIIKPLRDDLEEMGIPVKKICRDGLRGKHRLTITVMTSTKPPELKEITIPVQVHIHKVPDTNGKLIKEIQVRVHAKTVPEVVKYLDGVKNLLLDSGVSPVFCIWSPGETGHGDEVPGGKIQILPDVPPAKGGKAKVKLDKSAEIEDLKQQIARLENHLFRESAQEDRKVRAQVLR